MTKKIKVNIYYVISFLYIFIAYIGYDWSFHMVPHLKGTPILRIAIDLSTYIFLLVVGLGFLCAIFFISRNKKGALQVIERVFYGGLVVICIFSAITIALILLNKLGELYWYVPPTLVVLYIPALIMFLNRKNLVTDG